MTTTGSIKHLSALIDNASSVILTTADLDGDSVGTLVALYDLIRQIDPDTPLELVLETPLPARYEFLVPADIHPRIAEQNEDWSDVFAIVVDSEPSRFGTLREVFESAGKRGLIDHHQTTSIERFDFARYDPKSPSTTMLVYELYKAGGFTPSFDAARGLYAGLVFDTSIFRYKLTSPSSLRMAADLVELGIDHADIVERLLLVQDLERVQLRAKVLSHLERGFNGQFCLSVLDYEAVGDVDSGGLVDDLIFITEVHVAALLIELADGRSRISLRSRGQVDVAAIARGLHPTGGGHIRSAGVTLEMNLEEAATALNVALSAKFKT